MVFSPDFFKVFEGREGPYLSSGRLPVSLFTFFLADDPYKKSAAALPPKTPAFYIL